LADFYFSGILSFVLCAGFFAEREFVPRISWVPQTGAIADGMNASVEWVIAPGNFFLKFLGRPIIQGEKFSWMALSLSFIIFYSVTLVVLRIFGMRKPSPLEPKIPFEEFE
jgi:hypothetical protein